jgi:hypothetical protein
MTIWRPWGAMNFGTLEIERLWMLEQRNFANSSWIDISPPGATPIIVSADEPAVSSELRGLAHAQRHGMMRCHVMTSSGLLSMNSRAFGAVRYVKIVRAANFPYASGEGDAGKHCKRHRHHRQFHDYAASPPLQVL